MNALRVGLLAMLLVLCGLGFSPAVAQDDTNGGGGSGGDASELVPNQTFGSVKAGALGRRAPGNWVSRAIPRNPDITREDPHGEDFLPQLYVALLETLLTEIETFFNTIIAALDLSTLLGGLTDVISAAPQSHETPEGLLAPTFAPSVDPRRASPAPT